MDRIRFLREYVDLGAAAVLEIGALTNPVISTQAASVFYLDHLDTEGLRRKYQADPDVNINRIVEVKYVWNGGDMSSAIWDGRKFDIIVASHVFEHLSNPIRWLMDAKRILRPNGKIFLALPDKRFTFDLNRRNSNLSDWIGWYLRGLEKPSVEQIFDHFAHFSEVSTDRAWRDPEYVNEDFRHGSSHALEVAKLSLREKGYIDVHCSVFTPYQFVELCKEASFLGLFPYRIAGIEPTTFGDMEFLVLLEMSAEPPAEQIDNAKLQELARAAGYTDAFGDGRFARALESDAALKQRYDALVADFQAAMKAERARRATAFPELDKRLHHERPGRDDPRVLRTETGLPVRKSRWLWGRGA